MIGWYLALSEFGKLMVAVAIAAVFGLAVHVLTRKYGAQSASGKTPPSAATGSTNGSSIMRDRIAGYVVWIFGGGLLVFALFVAIAGASVAPTDEKSNLLMQVFTAIVGVVGTWVGTVLAFYYSRGNFEAASQQSRALAEQFASDRLTGLSAEQAMIRRSAIQLLVLPGGEAANATIEKLKTAVAGVPRLPCR